MTERRGRSRTAIKSLQKRLWQHLPHEQLQQRIGLVQVSIHPIPPGRTSQNNIGAGVFQRPLNIRSQFLPILRGILVDAHSQRLRQRHPIRIDEHVSESSLRDIERHEPHGIQIPPRLERRRTRIQLHVPPDVRMTGNKLNDHILTDQSAEFGTKKGDQFVFRVHVSQDENGVEFLGARRRQQRSEPRSLHDILHSFHGDDRVVAHVVQKSQCQYGPLLPAQESIIASHGEKRLVRLSASIRLVPVPVVRPPKIARHQPFSPNVDQPPRLAQHSERLEVVHVVIPQIDHVVRHPFDYAR
mmetsp:Transcript_25681/g.51608  ORF Transcript_25681/g.51608 Transcript_25681/m.51608 type:complete len:299 (+) Transcript_25681:741-1637(+)